MAIYTFTLTLAPGASNQRDTKTVGDVIVTRGLVRFPRGCAGLVGVRLLDREMQFAPLPAPTYLVGDGVQYDWRENRKLQGTPAMLSLEGYNLDDTYTHTIKAWIEVMDIRYFDGRGVY